jgi:hypothetical protein
MRKSILLLVLSIGCTVLSFGNADENISVSAGSPSMPEGGQDAFTAAFMQYVNASYYTSDVIEAFHDLHVAKSTKNKNFPDYLYYETTVEIPDFKGGKIVYGAKDQVAIAYFSRSYEESEVTEGEISWTMTLKWIREALGPNYTEKQTVNGGDKFHYFYLPGADINDEKAFHVMVYTHRYEASHNSMSVGFKINAVKK